MAQYSHFTSWGSYSGIPLNNPQWRNFFPVFLDCLLSSPLNIHSNDQQWNKPNSCYKVCSKSYTILAIMSKNLQEWTASNYYWMYSYETRADHLISHSMCLFTSMRWTHQTVRICLDITEKTLECMWILHFQENRLIQMVHEFFFKSIVGIFYAICNKKCIGFPIGSYKTPMTEFMFHFMCVKKPTKINYSMLVLTS